MHQMPYNNFRARLYSDKDCGACGGSGYYELYELEDWGDTSIWIPKGLDICECVLDRLEGVSFVYYNLGHEPDEEDVPF